MKEIFTEKERNGILSMGCYWEEVEQRDEPTAEIWLNEGRQLWRLLGPRKMLLAILSTAKAELSREGE